MQTPTKPVFMPEHLPTTTAWQTVPQRKGIVADLCPDDKEAPTSTGRFHVLMNMDTDEHSANDVAIPCNTMTKGPNAKSAAPAMTGAGSSHGGKTVETQSKKAGAKKSPPTLNMKVASDKPNTNPYAIISTYYKSMQVVDPSLISCHERIDQAQWIVAHAAKDGVVLELNSVCTWLRHHGNAKIIDPTHKKFQILQMRLACKPPTATSDGVIDSASPRCRS
jgi:hypothetical protein